MKFYEASNIMKPGDMFKSPQLNDETVIVKKENKSYKYLYLDIEEENYCDLCDLVINLDGEIIPAEPKVFRADEIIEKVVSLESGGTEEYTGGELKEAIRISHQNGRLERDLELRPMVRIVLDYIKGKNPFWHEFEEIIKSIPDL